jgi:predicted RNA polymerase sigma factor
VTAPEVVDRVWKAEAARLVAGLTRMTRDLALAEDLAQDALVQALEQWPGSGVPDNPGAWLMAVSKRRAIDHFRRWSGCASSRRRWPRSPSCPTGCRRRLHRR